VIYYIEEMHISVDNQIKLLLLLLLSWLLKKNFIIRWRLVEIFFTKIKIFIFLFEIKGIVIMRNIIKTNEKMSRNLKKVLSLKQFLLRQEVIKLYKDIFRTIRRVPDLNDRIYLRDWARQGL
jgi:hypothetical protein